MAKFHFVVPLMSRVSAGPRWDGHRYSVTDMVRRCTQTLLAQSEPDIAVTVVCHDTPAALAVDERLLVKEVDFPVPAQMDRETYEKLSGKPIKVLPDIVRRRVGDKYSKVKVGVARAFLDPECQALMLVDADDLVHRTVAEYALSNLHEFPGGFTVTSGYNWRVGDVQLTKVSGFHQRCGSCNIVGVTAAERDIFLERQNLHDFKRNTHWLFAGHASVHKRIRNAGHQTAKLPFRAAIYSTGHGANISKTSKLSGATVGITAALNQEFGGVLD